MDNTHISDCLPITDVTCIDCGGSVTAFLIPDKVWMALFRPNDWACLSCVLKRLNPSLAMAPAAMAETLSAELYRQRRKYKLKNVNRYHRARLPHRGLILISSDSITKLTAEQVTNPTTEIVDALRPVPVTTAVV